MSTKLGGFRWTVFDIIDAMSAQGHKVFRGLYDLNLVGIRTADDRSNTFNDFMLVFYADGSSWAWFPFPITTDPGLYWRQNLANVDGTAILADGQHRAMWKLGKHRGRYDALVQNKPVPVYRDADQDGVLDFDVPQQVGEFGINMHRANEERRSVQVDKWSAGCQVFADPHHFAFVMRLCNLQVETLGYKTFTYTLMTEQKIDDVLR